MRLPRGGKIVLATEGIVWVVIRHDRTLETALRQLLRPVPQQAEIRGAWGKLEAFSQPQQKLAASAADLARTAPDLFPTYFYFAGTPAETVGSQLLPRPSSHSTECNSWCSCSVADD